MKYKDIALDRFAVVVLLIVGLIYLSGDAHASQQTLNQFYTWIGVCIAALVGGGVISTIKNKDGQ